MWYKQGHHTTDVCTPTYITTLTLPPSHTESCTYAQAHMHTQFMGSTEDRTETQHSMQSCHSTAISLCSSQGAECQVGARRPASCQPCCPFLCWFSWCQHCLESIKQRRRGGEGSASHAHTSAHTRTHACTHAHTHRIDPMYTCSSTRAEFVEISNDTCT